MSSSGNEEQDREKERQAFLAAMKKRAEQAQASGGSPEQIRRDMEAYAREEGRRQAPKTVARARSWWKGFRNFVIVGVIAFGLAIGLALFVDKTYASPMCETYAAQHGLTYTGLDYPVVGSSSSTTSSGSCIFNDAAASRSTVRLRDLEPNPAISLLASFALQIEITIPAFFVLVALIAVGLSKLSSAR